MLKRNYIKLNSKKVVSYKRLCYEKLNDILIDKKNYQKVVENNQDNLLILDDEIKILVNKIKELSLQLKKINEEISNIEVEIYTCSYHHESLIKQRTRIFDDFKEDNISFDEHNRMNKDIDSRLVNLKIQYDNLINQLNDLKNKKEKLIMDYNKLRKDKDNLIIIKNYYSKNIAIAKKNIRRCNDNIDIVNNTLDNIDTLYFSDEDKVLEKDITPKVKKMRKIK